MFDPIMYSLRKGGGLPHVDVSFMEKPSKFVGNHILTKESSDKIGELAKAGVLAFTIRFMDVGGDTVYLVTKEAMTTDMDDIPYPWYDFSRMISNGSFYYGRFDKDIFDFNGYGTDRWTVNCEMFTFTTA